jgi:hypothetical protein
MLLQTRCGAMFGIGPRQKPPTGAKVNHPVAQLVYHGTRVNIITYLTAGQ